MQLEFSKMHGLGNDFVVIDAVRQRVDLTVDTIRFVADRHFGVGCDQLLLLGPPPDPASDFSYRIFNADGSEAGQCGNGARCAARFIHDRGMSDKRELGLRTMSRIVGVRVEDNGEFTVDMGVPVWEPAAVPFVSGEMATSYTLDLEAGSVQVGVVSMGNPHAVLIVDNIDTASVASLGPALGRDRRFPEGVNVGFMQVIDRTHIKLRVYERGAGETLACGTGACAAVVVGCKQGRLEPRVAVDLPGGALTVSWAGEGQRVLMTGPATHVFEGRIDL